MPDLFFYLFAAFTTVCALGVVLNRNTVNAAICLLLSLFGVAALFTLLDAYLLAVLLVLVYAGAGHDRAVSFHCHVCSTRRADTTARSSPWRCWPA